MCLPAGEPPARSKSRGSVPRGYWNFSWTAEDEFGFPEDVAPLPGELSALLCLKAIAVGVMSIVFIDRDTGIQLSVHMHEYPGLAYPLDS